jgi:quinol monooxygenase YgiN
MGEGKPGYVIKTRTKPGSRDAAIELGIKGFEGSDDFESWVICTDEDDPDALWVIEFFKDDEALARHQADQGDQEHRNAVRDLMAGPPVRSTVRAIARS